MWGIPDASEEELEAQFTQRSDGLWGVYRFKRGFGGEVNRSAPAYVKVFKPLLYKAYLWLKKRRGGGDYASLLMEPHRKELTFVNISQRAYPANL